MNPKTLLLIPIYAFSENTFHKKYEEYKQQIHKKYDTMPEDTIKGIIEHETFPQRSTLLNHIIGYITIEFWGNDLYFNVYLPLKMKRYIWLSRQRNFIEDIMANGTHFNASFCIDNEEIQQKTWDMVNMIIKEHIPNHYYVDKKRFYNQNFSTDYGKLIEMVKEEEKRNG